MPSRGTYIGWMIISFFHQFYLVMTKMSNIIFLIFINVSGKRPLYISSASLSDSYHRDFTKEHLKDFTIELFYSVLV